MIRISAHHSLLAQANDSARLALSWNAASGTTPARAITGSASSRMRPLGTAKVSAPECVVAMAAPLRCGAVKGNREGTAMAEERYRPQTLYQAGGKSVLDAFHNQALYCRA